MNPASFHGVVMAGAREAYPMKGARGTWWRVRFVARAMRCRSHVRSWLASGGSLAASIGDRPKMIGVVEWPYLNKDWEAPRRFEVVRAHHLEVDQMPWLRLGVHDSRIVTDLTDLVPGLQIVLDRPDWFLREGELSINLFVNDTRVYSLAFTLGREAGKRIAYIGAMQGRNLDNIEAIYKELTKKLHGTRPRDFLFTVFQLVCETAGVERILGVSEECRHHRHPYFGAKSQVTTSASYDDIWKDRDGVPAPGGFFELPAIHTPRPDSEIPTHKRSMYRKRYAMFDRLRADIQRFAGQAPAAPKEPSLVPAAAPEQPVAEPRQHG